MIFYGIKKTIYASLSLNNIERLMKATFKFFDLELKHTFSIAKFSRTSTPIILLELEAEGFKGYGEGSMVPYMGENPETATSFFKKIDWNKIKLPINFKEVHAYLESIDKGNPAAKAAIDIALHDLHAKTLDIPCYKLFGSEPENMPVTSYTVGIDTPEIIREKLDGAKGFKVIKVKLGRDNDEELINTIRETCDLPLYVDANQGWNDRKMAIDRIYWLHNKGVQLIEQPMDKLDLEGNAWLTERSPIPILADEAVQRIENLDDIKGAYHGINVKLMKSAGLYEGYRMIKKAKEFKMKVLIGCMSETSCATLAGMALAPLCDWADLDGPALTKNNPFKDPDFKDGKWQLPNDSGLGLKFK